MCIRDSHYSDRDAMHFILIEGHVKHYTDRFRPVALVLHLWIRNDNRKVGLVPCGKHAKQAGLAYDIAF